MKKEIRIQFLIAMFCALLLSFSVYAQSSSDVKIGNQIWMSKNLDVSTFRNGDVIPEAKSQDEWVKASENKKAAFCYYDFDPKYGEKYGKLYNWYAVKDPRGLAPKDYHVPSDAEWDSLATYLGGWDKAGIKLKSTTGWKNDGNGDNSSGFNGLPGGGCYSDGYFGRITDFGYFWSSSEVNTGSSDVEMEDAWNYALSTDSTLVGRFNYKHNGLSVRCLKD